MDWQKGRESDNVVEDSGGGGGFGGGGMRFGGFHLGIGGTILVVIIALIFPQTRPLIMGLFMGGDSTDSQYSAPAGPAQTKAPDANDPQVHFVCDGAAGAEYCESVVLSPPRNRPMMSGRVCGKISAMITTRMVPPMPRWNPPKRIPPPP